jgi:hypothetical protein
LGWGLIAVQTPKNFFLDGLRMLEHIMIPEAQDLHPQIV